MEWRRYAIREVAPAVPAQVRFKPDELVWHLGLEHIASHTGEIPHKHKAPAAGAGSSTIAFDQGNVLYSKLRPYLNKVAVPEEAGIATTELIPLRPREDLLYRKYLAYYLRSPTFLSFASQYVTGAKMPRVILDRFWAHELPLPPLSEQRRIVEILDQADRIRRLRVEADAKAERILPVLFIKMFGDPVTNPRGWRKRRISELAVVMTGNTPSRKKPKYYGDYIEWVKSDNLNTPSHYITRSSECLSEQGVGVGRTAPSGSTLVTCIAGSPGAIGNAALTERKVAFNQQINSATPRDGVDAYFLYGHFVVGKRLVQAASTGGMKGMVSKSRFSAIEFLAPPPDLQECFGNQCRRLCVQNESRLNQTRKLEELFVLITHRAFSGALTESWREAHEKELLQEMEQQARALAVG